LASNGSHTLTARARDAAGNQATSAAVTVTVSNASPQKPYKGLPLVIPGSIQAEDFDLGGEGIAYHDNSAGNSGGQYRITEDVDMVARASGDVVNGFETGEWLEYTVSVAQSTTYRIDLVVASTAPYAGTTKFHLEI